VIIIYVVASKKKYNNIVAGRLGPAHACLSYAHPVQRGTVQLLLD